MEQLELEKEKEKLSQIIEIIGKVLKEEELDLDNLFKDFTKDREEIWQIADAKKLHITNLETSLDKPYFARIDFTREEDGKTSTIYIGNNGVMDSTNIVVTDWRAPISSLYYDAEIGPCSFTSPEGIVKGNMSLKRQFEIEKGKLLEYFDVDLVSGDNLLQKYLNSNNDTRLKSIVSTIQKEQNMVIRKQILDNLIIQGVAGSGKTTVALHRIAYLVYNYIKNIKQSQYLIICPNPVFLNYIKAVLPELDVSGVTQCTYEDYARKYIEEDLKINSSSKKVTSYIAGKNTSGIESFKLSRQYKEMLDKFLDIYIYSITSKPLLLGDFEVLSSSTITEIFQSTKKGYINNLSNRIEITIDKLCRYIEENQDTIYHNYSGYSFSLFDDAESEVERNKLRSMFAKDRAEIAKNCRSIIRKYFNKSKLEATKLYKLFISTITNFDIFNYPKINELKKETNKNIKNNVYDFEDLPALMYIKSIISPNKEYEQIRHVVIDEAQDLGEFNFYVMKKTLPGATFSIFGDLAQSIYDYRSIKSWDEVNNYMFDNKGEIINFNKSYRTTAEIMNVADDVAESIGLHRSELVIRHGDDVQIDGVEEEKIPEHIGRKIREYQEKGYQTIAVISKTDLLSRYINDDLKDLGIDIPNVGETDDVNEERFRVCTISNQLAKGLEFDAVIINNANERLYSSNSNLDMKLLYVAITRALHELDIVYSGTLTKPLENSLNKEENRQIKI